MAIFSKKAVNNSPPLKCSRIPEIAFIVSLFMQCKEWCSLASVVYKIDMKIYVATKWQQT